MKALLEALHSHDISAVLRQWSKTIHLVIYSDKFYDRVECSSIARRQLYNSSQQHDKLEMQISNEEFYIDVYLGIGTIAFLQVYKQRRQAAANNGH